MTRTGQVPAVADWWAVERDDEGTVFHGRLMDALQRNLERAEGKKTARFAMLGLWPFVEDAQAHVRYVKRKMRERPEEDSRGGPAAERSARCGAGAEDAEAELSGGRNEAAGNDVGTTGGHPA
jgi:hypothetical protein